VNNSFFHLRERDSNNWTKRSVPYIEPCIFRKGNRPSISPFRIEIRTFPFHTRPCPIAYPVRAVSDGRWSSIPECYAWKIKQIGKEGAQMELSASTCQLKCDKKGGIGFEMTDIWLICRVISSYGNWGIGMEMPGDYVNLGVYKGIALGRIYSNRAHTTRDTITWCENVCRS